MRELRKHNVRTVLAVGVRVGSFTMLRHECSPEAKMVAVETHPESFELLERNTAHIPESQLLRINAAIAVETGQCLLAFRTDMLANTSSSSKTISSLATATSASECPRSRPRRSGSASSSSASPRSTS